MTNRDPVQTNVPLIESLRAILATAGQGAKRLEPALEELERSYDASVYSELIYLLSHLHFTPGDAKLHWQCILGHAEAMQVKLGTPVDPRLALVSYFTRVHPRLDNPKVIELELFQRTQESVYRDELTGLYNYRFFEECLAHEMLRSEQSGHPLSLVMIDVDNFKTYNDLNGHEPGSRVLARIGCILQEIFAETGIATRYGGEEFAIVLPSIAKLDARDVAERARMAIAVEQFDGEGSQPGGALTVSIGVATCPGDARLAAELVRCADHALYDAKKRGRNQARLYAESSRSYRRVDVALDGELRVLAADQRPIRTLSISEGGLLLVADQRLEEGSVVDLGLRLAGSDDRRIQTTGRVVSSKERPDGRFEVAVRFTSVEPRDRRLLRDHLRRDPATSLSAELHV